MPPRPRLVFLLNSAQRAVQQWIAQQADDAAEGERLGAAQAGVLFALARQDGPLMGELARSLDATPSALSGLIDRMARAGLLERRPCEADGRALRVWLREPGRAQLPALQAHTDRLNRQLTEGFSPEELATVARWLSHVRSRLQP